VTLLAGARVFDPETGETTRADVRLDGPRIAEVGPGLDGDERVDCSGGLLIPGLIDCHVHVAFRWPESLPRSARVLEAVPVLHRLLARGITTVRDAWGADAGFRHALREGWITGPDLPSPPRTHVDLTTELRLLAAVLGDAAALKAATSEAARLLRLDDDRGRIEPGLRADVVVLDGTGLDVADLPGRIRDVWHDGKRVGELTSP
jgi:imidazolonepropionase-like amidohydrolase